MSRDWIRNPRRNSSCSARITHNNENISQLSGGIKTGRGEIKVCRDASQQDGANTVPRQIGPLKKIQTYGKGSHEGKGPTGIRP